METAEFAAKFAESVGFGAVIALHGELGAGKTVFSRGFAREGLGVKEPIQSPTFVIVQEYPVKIHGKKGRLCHFDLYRINDSESGLAFGIDDYFRDLNTVILIEWAERIKDILPEKTIHIGFEHVSETKRKIKIIRTNSKTQNRRQ